MAGPGLSLRYDPPAVGCARPIAIGRLRSRAMQDGLGQRDLRHSDTGRLAPPCGNSIDDHGVAARLGGWPEQRHMRLLGNVFGRRCTDGAADDAAAKIDRNTARVRTILSYREQIGLAAVLRDRFRESEDWHGYHPFTGRSIAYPDVPPGSARPIEVRLRLVRSQRSRFTQLLR